MTHLFRNWISDSMHSPKLLNLLMFSLFFVAGTLLADNEIAELCPKHLWIRAPEKITLSDNEAVLVCGVRHNPAWDNVPLNQAMVHLRAMLQTRGYHFAKLSHEGDRDIVDTGSRVYVTESLVGGKPPADWNINKFRKVVGEPLTPSLLEDYQKRVESDLKHRGYACPKLESQAFAESGRIHLTIHPGLLGRIRKIDIDGVEGLAPEALTRFYAFAPGDIYDSYSLLLSSMRMEADGILQSTFFETKCVGESVDVHQKHLAGAPRILRMGTGVNTERGFIGYVDWKHARIGELGSSLTLGAKFSYRDTRRNIQQVLASARWFGLKSFNRLYLETSAGAVHESHENYHNLNVNFALTPTITWDNQNFGAVAGIGPTLNGTLTYRGEGRPKTFYSTIKGFVRWIEHELELNYGDPKSGLEFRIQAEASEYGVLSEITARSVNVDGRYLWNIGDLSPATFILGFRWRLSTTFAPDDLGGYNALPASLRTFLGGSSDVRGYALKEIPGAGGAPTLAYLGTEMRVAEVLPWGLQPIALLDIGRAGSETLWLNSPTYFSAGPGLRWASPVGVFRATLARGWASGRPSVASQRNYSQWQFLLGYGEEF